MAKKAGPYIGVTGFMSNAEVNEALAVIPPGSKCRLGVGVLMNSQTLTGQTNKLPGRYPKREHVASIFADDPRALNLIHYSMDKDNPDILCTDLRWIVELAGPYLDGFQLNVKWPLPSQIQQFVEIFPDMYLALQIGSSAMAEFTSMGIFEESVGSYIPEVDAILIDPSGGKGRLLDAARVAEYFRAIQHYPVDLVAAGGLGPDTLDVLDPLIQEFPDMSIDAEGSIRTMPPEDALDLLKMQLYLWRAYLKLEGKRI